jgi:hypothetical protein
MDKKIAGLLGAAAALATVGGAHAAALDGNGVDSGLTYRDLLNPVPNAVEALKADDAQRESGQTTTEVAQVYIGVGHHHHHHHHHARARVRIIPPVRHHHHHHHHHNSYYSR